jgi:hypothetical protein
MHDFDCVKAVESWGDSVSIKCAIYTQAKNHNVFNGDKTAGFSGFLRAESTIFPTRYLAYLTDLIAYFSTVYTRLLNKTTIQIKEY